MRLCGGDRRPLASALVLAVGIAGCGSSPAVTGGSPPATGSASSAPSAATSAANASGASPSLAMAVPANPCATQDQPPGTPGTFSQSNGGTSFSLSIDGCDWTVTATSNYTLITGTWMYSRTSGEIAFTETAGLCGPVKGGPQVVAHGIRSQDAASLRHLRRSVRAVRRSCLETVVGHSPGGEGHEAIGDLALDARWSRPSLAGPCAPRWGDGAKTSSA